jgi:hypothetical protein
VLVFFRTQAGRRDYGITSTRLSHVTVSLLGNEAKFATSRKPQHLAWQIYFTLSYNCVWCYKKKIGMIRSYDDFVLPITFLAHRLAVNLLHREQL